MTLILTELSDLGIAMAADSAVTLQHRDTGILSVSSVPAQKLQIIKHLNAGLSCWGTGNIDGVSTDDWLRQFIDQNILIPTMKEFAEALATELNTKLSPNGQANLGFHLAGFETYRDRILPSFYHIHDGPSSTLAQRNINVDPNRFNANHDIPPEHFEKLPGRYWITRNGSYILYVQIFGLLDSFFRALKKQHGIVIPHTNNLNDRAEYLVFQIRTMSEIYRLSNLVPGIGGPISYLTITPQGIQSFGVRFG